MSEWADVQATEKELEDLEKDYLDKKNPRSLYNIAPAALQKALDRVSKHFFEKSESELYEEVKPDRVLNLLRFRFWEEYNNAQDKGRMINLDKISTGICTLPYLYNRVFRSPIMVAWLLTPPAEYQNLAKEALETGLFRLREILEMPLYDKKGNPNTSVANLMLKAIHMLDLRVHGSPTQRHEIKSLSVHTKAGGDVARLVEDANMDEVEKQLMQLRSTEEKVELLNESRPKYEKFKSRAIDIESPTVRKKGGKEF